MTNKSSTKRRLRTFGLAAGVLAIVGTAAFFVWRSTWTQDRDLTLREAFTAGSIGTELVPKVVFDVLPGLFPDQFQPAGPDAGDWVEQFGFIRGAPDSEYGLPVGLVVSQRAPQTGEPAPVEFVGFSCSVCHTNVIRTRPDDPGFLVYGMGSTSLDFFAWVDAFRTAVLDEERLTLDTIGTAYEARTGESLGLLDKLAIRQWLSGAREALHEQLPKYDAPYSGAELRDSRLLPIGPGRSQAFKALVQLAMDRPGATDRAYSKLPVVYRQADKPLAQFDGSAKDIVLRSALAALGTGATLESLAVPQILDNVTKASEYTRELEGPTYAEVFPDLPINADRVARGRDAYLQFCDACHGHPGGDGTWVAGSRQGEIVPLAEIGTDPERVLFRYYELIGPAMYEYFPDDHPLNPEGDDLRGEGELGFLNAPISSAFTRAPYLHNGSVPTMAELINLQPRRPVFYRGRSLYDPESLGLMVPTTPDERNYWRFDTSSPGDGNGGHDYPWPYRGPGWDEETLRDLLEYLKTI